MYGESCHRIRPLKTWLLVQLDPGWYSVIAAIDPRDALKIVTVIGCELLLVATFSDVQWFMAIATCNPHILHLQNCESGHHLKRLPSWGEAYNKQKEKLFVFVFALELDGSAPHCGADAPSNTIITKSS